MRIAVVLIPVMLFAQVAKKANENYQTPEGRAGVASSIGSTTRDSRQKPKELVAALEIRPGMVVADIGTGAGYMLPHLSEAVGPTGKVLAEDIFPDFIETAKKRTIGLKNVDFILGSDKSTNLPADVADVLFTLDAYHHFDYPQVLLADFARVLKKDGRLIVVEYHKNKESMANGRALEHVRLSEEDAIKEIEATGWKLVSRSDFIPRVQWMAVFQKK